MGDTRKIEGKVIERNSLKILDTFAGAGGFSLGFELAGCEVVGGIEIDKWASETFAANHPSANVLCADMEDLSDDELLSEYGGDHKPNVVLGGPPCQGFSRCLKNAGDPKDPRNSLFHEFLRTIRIFEPNLLVMENVPYLLRAKTASGDSVVEIVVSDLRELGYDVHHRVLNATDFGIPQMRQRLFIVGSKKPLDSPFPKPTHYWLKNAEAQYELPLGLEPCPNLWDAISDMPEIEAREGAEEMNYDKPAETSYQIVLREGSTKLFNHKAMRHSKRLVERFASMKLGDTQSDVPEEHRPRRRSGNGEISGKVYDQNNRRMHPDRPCHTVPASFYANFVHPFKHRNFTPREGARIQSFPDWFVFKGKPTVVSHKLLERENRLHEKFLCQYNQIGNAVPPLLAKRVAENLIAQS